jgi:hypothetical protein
VYLFLHLHLHPSRSTFTLTQSISLKPLTHTTLVSTILACQNSLLSHTFVKENTNKQNFWKVVSYCKLGHSTLNLDHILIRLLQKPYGCLQSKTWSSHVGTFQNAIWEKRRKQMRPNCQVCVSFLHKTSSTWE